MFAVQSEGRRGLGQQSNSAQAGLLQPAGAPAGCSLLLLAAGHGEVAVEQVRSWNCAA